MEAELITDIWTIIQVILLDLALGGDNSIVIGMAAKTCLMNYRKSYTLRNGRSHCATLFMAMIVVYLYRFRTYIPSADYYSYISV